MDEAVNGELRAGSLGPSAFNKLTGDSLRLPLNLTASLPHHRLSFRVEGEVIKLANRSFLSMMTHSLISKCLQKNTDIHPFPKDKQ